MPVALWCISSGISSSHRPGPRLARRLLTVYARPGDTVIAAGNTTSLGLAATGTGRRCLTAGDQPGGDPAGLVGSADLVVAGCPQEDPPHRKPPVDRYGQWLQPGGCFVAVVTSPPRQSVNVAQVTSLIAAARRAGLSYRQHVVAVEINAERDSFTYPATPAQITAWRHAARLHTATGQLVVIHDLLVFLPDGAGHE